MALYPGATFKPTPLGGKVRRNRQGRGMLHVAVSNAKSLPPSSGTTWHFYVAKAAPDGSTDGSGGPAYCEQYVDTEYRAYGGADGNDDQIIVETAGGLGSSAQLNAEPWTRAQQLRIIDLMRWEASQPGGAPLELLPDAKAGRRGWGPHRLGIKHSRGLVPGWWFPGCELWSNALGKECPGDAKVAQVPGLVREAREGDDMAGEGAAILALLKGSDPKRDRLDSIYYDLRGDIRSLSGALTGLTKLVAEQNGLSLEDVRRVVAEEVARGIDVDVTVTAAE